MPPACGPSQLASHPPAPRKTLAVMPHPPACHPRKGVNKATQQWLPCHTPTTETPHTAPAAGLSPQKGDNSPHSSLCLATANMLQEPQQQQMGRLRGTLPGCCEQPACHSKKGQHPTATSALPHTRLHRPILSVHTPMCCRNLTAAGHLTTADAGTFMLHPAAARLVNHRSNMLKPICVTT